MPIIIRANQKNNVINVKNDLRSGFTYMIYAYAGDDIVYGYKYVDIIYGGAGNDILFGYVGNDILYGSTGHDRLYGGQGNDKLYGEAGKDRLYGGIGHDSLWGGNARDILYGHQGRDKLYGGKGKDTLNGGKGNDRLYGDNDKDKLLGGVGHDKLFGGNGDDTLKGHKGRDKLYGEKGNDKLIGGKSSDKLFGGEGDDLLYGGLGNDKLYGGVGDDKLYGDLGNDFLMGGRGDDLLSGAEGSDLLYGDKGSDNLYGGDGQDTLNGGDGDDFLYGGRHRDRLNGDNGHDTLLGGDDNDQLYGGEGDDILLGGNHDDELNGDNGSDLLAGGAGDDWLYGGQDSDELKGDAGSDILIGGKANDNIYGGDGDDTVIIDLDKDLNLDGDAEMADGGQGMDILALNYAEHTLSSQQLKEVYTAAIHYLNGDSGNQILLQPSNPYYEQLLNLELSHFEIITINSEVVTKAKFIIEKLVELKEDDALLTEHVTIAKVTTFFADTPLSFQLTGVDQQYFNLHDNGEVFLTAEAIQLIHRDGNAAIRELALEVIGTNENGNTIEASSAFVVTPTNDVPEFSIDLEMTELVEESVSKGFIARLNAIDPEQSANLDYQLQNVVMYEGSPIIELNVNDKTEVHLTDAGVAAINDDAFREAFLSQGIMIEAKVIDNDGIEIVEASAGASINIITVNEPHSLIGDVTLYEVVEDTAEVGQVIASIEVYDAEDEVLTLIVSDPSDVALGETYLNYYQVDSETTLLANGNRVYQLLLSQQGFDKVTQNQDFGFLEYKFNLTVTDTDGNEVETGQQIVNISYGNSAPVLNESTSLVALTEEANHGAGLEFASISMFDREEDTTIELIDNSSTAFKDNVERYLGISNVNMADYFDFHKTYTTAPVNEDNTTITLKLTTDANKLAEFNDIISHDELNLTSFSIKVKAEDEAQDGTTEQKV